MLQTLSLMRHRLGDSVHIEEYVVGKSLLLSYWRFVVLTLPYLTCGVDVCTKADTQRWAWAQCATPTDLKVGRSS